MDIKQCVLRLVDRYRLSQLTSDNPEAGGLNYRTATLGVGVECLNDSFFAELQLEDTASDASNLGAWRRLVSLEMGSEAPIFWDWLRGEVALRGGLGRSALNRGGGTIPIPGGELVAGARVSMGVEIPINERAFATVGVSGDILASSREYLDSGAGLFGKITFGIRGEGGSDACFSGLQAARRLFEEERQRVVSSREKGVQLLQEYRDLKTFVPDLLKFEESLYADVEPWCNYEPISPLPFETDEELEAVPEYWALRRCEEDRNAVESARREIRLYDGTLEKRVKNLKESVQTMKGKMEALLAWEPQCYDFKRPSRYLWFANDNPDLFLTPQKRDDVHEGKIHLFSNPQLDEILLFLKQNPDTDVGITTFANQRGENDRNAELSRGRLNTILQYLLLEGCAQSSDFQDAQGPYCRYQPVNRYGHVVKNFEGEEKRPLYIGGVYLSPKEQGDQQKTERFILPKNRVAWAGAYSPDEVRNNPGIKKKTDIRLPDGKWVTDEKSPLFRVAVFTFVKREPK